MSLKIDNGWCFDIEANNLYPYVDTIWTIHFKSIDKKKHLVVNPFKDDRASEKAKEFIHSFDDGCVVAAHNGLGYDLWVLWKLLGITPRIGKSGGDYLDGKRIQFIDTFFLSMFLIPDLPSHSLEAHGKRLGELKLPYRQTLIDNNLLEKNAPKGKEFSFYTVFMEEYCEQDVDVTIKLLKDLWGVAKARYPSEWLHRGFKASQKSFYLMNAQEFTGVGFDKEYALEVQENLKKEIEEIRSLVEPQLPNRPLLKGEEKFYSMPKNPEKADGSISSNMFKFIEKHGGEILNDGKVRFYGKDYLIESEKLLDVELKMEMKDQGFFKDWLLELGWEPTYWNIKRGSDGKPERDPKTRKLIKTSPKIQESGNICPNLEQMEMPIIKDIVKYLSLRNRLGVISGWINHPRLHWDGRLPAGSTKITPTFRQCHNVVCNVPKAEDGVLYGKEFRSLFIATDENLFASADAAAGENRTEASYTIKYTGGKEYVDDLLDGDPHSKNAKAFYPDKLAWADINDPTIKDNPAFRPYRSKSKNGKYALTFGCAPDKLAKTLGIDASFAQKSYDAFWEANPALKSLKESVESYWEGAGKKKYLPAIDGRILCTRAKHALLNMLFQSALAIAMDYACCIIDKKLGELYLDSKGRPYYNYKGSVVKRVLYYHDEVTTEQSEEISKEMADIIASAIIKAGEMVKLKIPLDADGIVGKNWKEIH